LNVFLGERLLLARTISIWKPGFKQFFTVALRDHHACQGDPLVFDDVFAIVILDVNVYEWLLF
jgi:hypothetical protein